MNEFQNKNTKKLYLKSKLIVKRWEEEFSAKNGRLPTREDIKLSPAYVRECYNRYYRIKTELLASQILTEDDFVCDVVADESSALKQLTHSSDGKNNIVGSENAKSDKNSIDCNQEKNKFSSTNNINSKTWGSQLNVKATDPKIDKSKCTLLTFFSQKLFKGSTFKKRNPRKACSFGKNRLNKSISQETTNLNFQEKNNSSLSLNSDNLTLTESFVSEGNEGISQAVDLTNLSPPSFSSSLLSSSSFLSSSATANEFSRTEALITVNDRPVATQKLSLIQEISLGSRNAAKTFQSVQEGWVERCVASINERQEPKRNSDSGFDSIENSPLLLENKENDAEKSSSSDDDLICDSDNELGHVNKNSGLSIPSQKRKAIVSNVKSGEERVEKLELDEHDPVKMTPLPPAKKIKLDANPAEVDTESNRTENAKKVLLKRKIQSGTLNENYVKINLERKIYVRGKRNFNFCKYKKQQWKKDKKMLSGCGDRESGGIVQCFKCGKKGHFSKKCKIGLEDQLLDINDENEKDEENILPTLEEAQKMAEEKAKWSNFQKRNTFAKLNPPEEEEEDSNRPKIEPLYPLGEDNAVIKTPPQVFEALAKFGHKEFRPGQEEAIMRILSGLSTLLMISTGGGKSLCYQLPAYLYAKNNNCITLVVSPLVSLMEDQVSGSSSVFKAACLHTSQTEKQRESVLEDAKKGKIHALLISPEAVVSGDSFKGFGSIFRQLPPIAFACIDEVHCISQWSHNFRPSYLMINRVLKEKYGISTILGLTATATVSSIKSITNELGISSEKDVIKDIPLPDNLFLTVSKDKDKDDALIQLLKSPRFQEFNSILIYCTRRDDCERLAVLIRTVLQNLAPFPSSTSQSNRKRLSSNAESYHAGMAAARRKQVQKAFMSGNLRIVVATVAFGMGINKQDIRAVIHYNMPRDFESYVQETGRAGRDGLFAHCHLFLNPNGQDLNELRRHIHSNSIDRYILRKLLEKVFVDCDCREKGAECAGHEVAFSCEETIQALDIPEENINTLLCYLELHNKKFIKVLAPAYLKCRIKSYLDMKHINSAALKCPPLAYACALEANSCRKKSSILEFNVMEVARKIGWESGVVKSQLKKLEWESNGESSWKKTGMIVEFYELGFRLLAKGDLSAVEQDEALEYLTQRVKNQEERSCDLLNVAFSTLHHFSCDSHAEAIDVVDEENSNKLKAAIRHYFETETMLEEVSLKHVEVEDFNEEEVAQDVRALLALYKDNTFNARAVARIFYGIQSPNYPASMWFKCKFWRKHLNKDFNKLISIAKLEILRQRF